MRDRTILVRPSTSSSLDHPRGIAPMDVSSDRRRGDCSFVPPSLAFFLPPLRRARRVRPSAALKRRAVFYGRRPRRRVVCDRTPWRLEERSAWRSPSPWPRPPRRPRPTRSWRTATSWGRPGTSPSTPAPRRRSPRRSAPSSARSSSPPTASTSTSRDLPNLSQFYDCYACDFSTFTLINARRNAN